jgi:hypothetical protein
VVFKTLVSDVAMGQVGAIFSLVSSRLARANKDWHRLLELCAVTKTLVFDGDGCYDSSDFNDSLVLGMKGTFAQAELHIIRARLHGAKLRFGVFPSRLPSFTPSVPIRSPVSTGMFSRLSLSRFMSYLPLLSFGPSVTIPGSAYLLTPPFGMECLTSLADDIT